jgi:hypothetical protein
MYQFTEPLNLRQHFWFDGMRIKNQNWAPLSPAAKTVFPVIAAHTDAAGHAFPSEQTIAILSGLTEKTARAGIHGLEALPGFTASPYVTARGRRSKRFHVKAPPIEIGRSFPFFKCILDGGNWSQLTPTAHALYPVMRTFGHFDFYDAPEDETADPSAFKEEYIRRTFDLCEAEPDILADAAGISRKSLGAAMQSLVECHLLEQTDEGLRVYLIPPRVFKPSWLNKRVAERYRETWQRKKLPVKHGKKRLQNGKR